MKAITFYMSNIDQSVIDAQKRVFDHFGMELEQIKTTLTHGEAIDHYLNNNEWDEIAIFDIDCIPLHKDVLKNAEDRMQLKDTRYAMYGAAQKANHIPNSNLYVSPAFCCLTKELWRGWPNNTFVDIPGHDVGGFFTENVLRGGYISMIFPSHVEVPMWDLRPGEKFGLGTTYGTEVYHAFLSRQGKESAKRFINKCKEVING